MKECPIKDAAGRCCSFMNYIVGALVRQGCTNKYDPEESLQRIAFHMLSPVGEGGQPRKTLFDIDLTRDWDLARGNPLEARFKTFFHHDLAAICVGNIPRLAYVQRRPGTMSIGPPRMSPDQRDYRSIVAVMQQHGERANLGILGKARRRWLEFKPRDPSSPHPHDD